VTGVDLTREFATVAYSADHTHMECKFSAVAPGLASASAELWGSWEVKGLVRTNCGPRPVRPPQRDHGSSGGSTLESAIPLDEYNQCVFIRYYTIHKFLGMIPEVIKAGAGEHQLPKRDPRGDNTGEEGLRASSDDNSTEVDCTETGSHALGTSDEVEVIHNVSSVCPEHYTHFPPLTNWTKDDRDGFDIVAEFIFQVRNLLYIGGTKERTRFNREPKRNRCYCTIVTFKTFSRYACALALSLAHSNPGGRRRDDAGARCVWGGRTGRD
jgi:hypothetical protein